MHGRGWTIAPVWLKDLHQLRPCLLYICIAQFHKDAGNYQWPGGSYLGCYNSVSTGSPSCLPASTRGWGLICNHLVWLTSVCSDQYLAPDPTSTNQIFVYCNPLAFRIKHVFIIWSKMRGLLIWRCAMLCKCVIGVLMRELLNVTHVLCQSVAFWIIFYHWRADLLTKLIAFGSMP